MGFSPVECVVSYVESVDPYILKHSYVRLPGQGAVGAVRQAMAGLAIEPGRE